MNSSASNLRTAGACAETRLFIDNEESFDLCRFVPSVSNETFSVISPTSNKELCAVSLAQQADVDLAVAAAQRAFGPWSALSAYERSVPLSRLVGLISANAHRLAILEGVCMGKPVELLKRMDIPACAGIFHYYAGSAHHILGETSMAAPNFINMSIRQPYGVVGLIIPWNVSMIMFAMKVAPAVLAGNTVVLKSSEKSPLSTLALAALIKEAGFPPGVINILSGPGLPTGKAIASHMAIRKIAFTGSTAIGREIMKMAADSNLKNVSLELGGKNPAIVFDDADLESAVTYTHFSINHNSGQHCQANSRILVQRTIASEFISRMRAVMEKVVLGDPACKKTFQGPQVDSKQLSRMLRLAEVGEQDGKLLMGGKQHGDTGVFMQPTILLDVPPSSEAYQNEIFGPVVIINTFDTEQEALEEANSTEFGLFASVFTNDFERALRVSKELQCGGVGVNCSVPLRAVDMPVGGWKQSGIGRELSHHGLEMYTELKTIFMKYGRDPTALSSKWHCAEA